MEIIQGNVLLEILTPALGRACALGHRNKCDVEATLAIIAVLRYKKDKDQHPESLGQLKAAGYLRELPMDPYSDRPLVYRKADGSFILYSIGPNFEDDGGEPGTDRKGRPKLWTNDADVVFWPVHKSQVKQ